VISDMGQNLVSGDLIYDGLISVAQQRGRRRHGATADT